MSVRLLPHTFSDARSPLHDIREGEDISMVLQVVGVVEPNIGAAGIAPSGCGLTSHNLWRVGASTKSLLSRPHNSSPKKQRPVRLLPHTLSDAGSPLHDTNRYTAPEKSEWYDFSPYSESPPPQGLTS